MSTPQETTAILMQLVLANLPDAERFYLADGNPTLHWDDTSEDRIPRPFDVVISAERLARYDDPLHVIAQHLNSCRMWYAALMPHNERFREETLPERIEDFQRIFVKRLQPGEQLLVLYASAEYLAARPIWESAAAERAKWNACYSDLDQAFLSLIDRLLPDGGRILEVGCGAGWQSLALARSGRHQVDLLDISQVAVDAFVEGKPQYDLVFNAGVVEHYPLERQAQLLRGMASRSRNYVVCLAPNRSCYWNSLSGVRNITVGNWPFAQEAPLIDFRTAFEAAGLNYSGQSYLGMIGGDQAAYIVAGVATVAPGREAHISPLAVETTAELRSELHRARRAAASAEARIAQFEAGTARYTEAHADALEAYRGQRAWKVMLALRRAYTMVVRDGWKGGLRLLLGPRPPLEEYELSFPILRTYLPRPRPADALGSNTALARAADQSAPCRYDIVILAIIDFDFRFQRPQQLAAQFARQGHRVFWVSATRLLPLTSPEPYHVVQLRENIWEVQARAPKGELYVNPLSDDALRGFATALEHLYRDWAVAETAVFVQLPFWRRLALQLRREPSSVTVYDCMDDWDAFKNVGASIRAEEAPLTEECDVLAVTAENLRAKFAGRRLDPVLIRNGTDFEFFRTAEPLTELAAMRRPVIGYFGAIADWIDLDLLYKVAKARPGYSFVLAGQVFGRDTKALEALPNVRLLGSRPYEQMPSLLASFDVCVVPFLLNQVTHATDPVKLYEYLSQGKPVVATDMAELRIWSDLLYLAHDADQFAAQLDAAVAESDPALRTRRIEFARSHSWPARVAQFDAAIRKSFPRISILIVTYNSAEFIAPCLRSVLAYTSYPNYEVIVVDNASSDESPAIAEGFSTADSRIRVVRLAVNRGFSGGNNAAAELATGDYIAFLNADTMVTAGWLGYLLRHLVLDPSVGLICPVTNFAGNEVKINIDYTDETGMRSFAMEIARQKRGEILDVAAAPLFCALMRSDLLRQIGGLDEEYRVGMFEDDDLAAAVRESGLRVCAAEGCFVHHFGQGSFSKLAVAEYNRIFETNRRQFEHKWKRPWVRHQTRPDVRPVEAEQRFVPARFCEPDPYPRATPARPST